MICAECKRKNVYIDSTGLPAEFCSNQCRKVAVESGHVQPCIKCRIWPMVRLPDGTRSPFCGKACQNSGMGSMGPSVRPPISLQQPPYRPMMPPPQFNQPNPPIGMPPHPTQLLPGGGRPGPWVTATVPFCRNCQQKPCWKDSAQTYSSYCSRRCKEIAERAPRVVSSMNNANNAPLTSQQNYNMSPNSPISPVLQTNGILSSLQGGQSGSMLPSSQGGNILSSSQGGNISPQGGNMSHYSLYQQQQPSYQKNNMQNVQQQQHFQNQQLQSPQNNIQQPQFPQNPSNNIQHPRQLSNESIPQSQKSDNSLYHNSQRQHDNDFDDSNDLQQSQASASSQNNHHLRYLDTATPISHPRTDSRSSNSQSPPPIPNNKPTLVNPQAPINITINTSLPLSSQQPTETHPRSPPSPPPRKTGTRPRSPPSPPPRKTKKDLDYQFQFQGQVREQNQLYHPPVQQSPVQVQEQNRPLSPQSQSQSRSPQSPNRPQSQNQIPSQSRPQSQNQIPSQSRPQSQSQIPSQSRPQSQNQIQSQSQPQSQNQIQSQIQPQSQPRLRNQPQSQSQPQVPNHSQPQPQPQSDGSHPDDNFMITPYTNPEAPPPYTPNDAYVPLGDRKVTRDDSFDEDNPYGFRDDDSNVQDQNNDQPNYIQEQRTQRNILRRR